MKKYRRDLAAINHLITNVKKDSKLLMTRSIMVNGTESLRTKNGAIKVSNFLLTDDGIFNDVREIKDLKIKIQE